MSKGPSAPPSKPSNKWLRNYTFLLDENYCGEPLQKALAAAGWQVKRQSEVFALGLSDEDLLRLCARHGYILITPDNAMRMVKDHRAVFHELKLAIVLLRIAGDAREVWSVWASALLYNESAILKALRKAKRPFSIKVTFASKARHPRSGR